MVQNDTAEFPGSVNLWWEMLQVDYYQVRLMVWGMVQQGFQTLLMFWGVCTAGLKVTSRIFKHKQHFGKSNQWFQNVKAEFTTW